MKKASILIILVFMLAAALPASAITGGVPDNGAHPYVGLVGFFDASGNFLWRCTGTLLSPTVVLTAGHCTDGAASARIWFDENIVIQDGGYPYAGGYTGTPHTHPNFHWALPDTYDVGVIVLDKRVKGISGVGELPAAGYLDDLATQRGQNDLIFTVVGYGLQEIRPTYIAERSRYKATSTLVNLTSALTDGYNLHTSNNPGGGAGRGDTSGGTCFGDSGGPVFHGDDSSHLIVGVTSFGLNENCKGADFAFRTDVAAARDWILGFLS